MTYKLGRRAALMAGAGLAAFGAQPARAQSPRTRIGVLTDLSGPYSDNAGEGSVVAAQLAADDFCAAHPGFAVDIVKADFQNRPDVAVQIARQWFDNDHVDVILDVVVSSAALAIATLVREKNKVALFTGPATADLTGSACGPNHVHWTYDTWSLSAATGRALVAEGGDSCYFITADYAFGHALERDTTGFVKAAGGKVLGSSPTPFPGTTDFSAFLLRAQQSGAKIIGLANGGADTVNCAKQAREFGVTAGGQRLAGLLMAVNDVHALGLEDAQGIYLSETFYWDMNEGTRTFAHRYAPLMKGAMPGKIHAGGYSATLHYLKAAAALGIENAQASGRAAVAQMKAMPTDDPLFGRGSIRSDGRKLHDVFLFQVKTPSESRYPWDYYNLRRTVPAADAFRPLADGGCTMTPA